MRLDGTPRGEAFCQPRSGHKAGGMRILFGMLGITLALGGCIRA